jgi:Xaa-Pro aminopeptidase
MIDLSRIQDAVRAEGLDWWLFCNFHHRDALSDRVLGLPGDSTNSRWWFYLVPASGEPVRIVHPVEGGALDSLPGRLLSYASRGALEAVLGGFRGARVGVHWSETVSAVSTLDHGTALLLEAAGLILVPGDGLVQRLQGLLDRDGIASHEAASRNLYEIVRRVWDRIDDRFRKGHAIGEVEVQRWMLALFGEMGMETDHPPIVAAGIHSNDPHFAPGKATDRRFEEGDVIQFDLWAKLRKPASIYADISWLGIFGTEVPARVRAPFAALVAARDSAATYIAETLATKGFVTGAEVDAAVRSRLIAAGYEAALRHRTGHGIDVEVHGSGANLDSIEFPDRRRLVDGACFSVEPGLYFEDFGLRTEIDIYMEGGQPKVSGDRPQRELLLCGSP